MDCLIIGAGLIGMLTARELARAGMKVSVLDKSKAGSESSWAGGGILSPLYPWRYPEPVTRMAIWGQQHYQDIARSLEDESGIDPEWTKSGLLILDMGEKNEAKQWAASFSLPVEDMESSDQLHSIEPNLFPEADQALWFPEIGQIRNPRLIKSVKGSLGHFDVEILEGYEVTSFLQERNRISGVRTNQGTFHADRVIVSAGAWSSKLFDGLGIKIQVEPVRGQMILFNAKPDLVQRIILDEGRYLIPRRDGRILMGSTLEYTGFEKITTDQAKQELYQKAIQLVPELRKYEVEGHWAGLRPGSPSGIPYVGQHPDFNNLYISAGHFRNGVILAPASVRLLADLILNQGPAIDPEAYSIQGH